MSEPLHGPPPAGLPGIPPEDAKLAPEQLPAFAPRPGSLALDARAYLERGRQTALALHRSGAGGRTVVRVTSELMDRLLRGVLEALCGGSGTAPAADSVALVGLGGYGRRELAPRSDLDLLLLYESEEGGAEPPAPIAALAEKMLYLLWDLKLEVGWGVRTAAQCAQLAAEDHTARTALVDCRLIAGSERAWRGLQSAVLSDLLTRQGEQFIRDKVEEMRRRHLRYGDTVFLLEPDLKQSEGGLRDLQAALWIARTRFKTSGISDLLHRSVLPPGEVSTLLRARDFLWRLRNELHWSTGRKEDRLTFDQQVRIAETFGYRDGPEGLAVEQLMRHYYLAASAIKRAADALVDRCEEASHRTPPLERKLDHELKVWNGRITFASSDLLARSPAAILRLFAAADRESIPLHSWARDRISQEAWRLAQVRSSPEVAATFRQMLVRPGTRGDLLVSMHELGVLPALLPELARVTAKAQHDLYHVYTVDVHCLFALQQLYALRNGEVAEKEPRLTRLAQQLERPLPLYLAALLHDAGKGGGPGHAERGAVLAKAVAERLGLTPEDARDAQWLVREHLTMSFLSQRRDLSDPMLIEGLARSAGSAQRLLMLYLLTYADLSSVGPDTWTDWKGRLLEELWSKARAIFEGDRRSEASAKEALRRELCGRFPPAEVAGFFEVMPARYLRSVAPADAARHLRLLNRGRGHTLAAALTHRSDFTELALTAADRPGLLSIFSGALAAHRLGILRAEIVSTCDGRALDIFAVQQRPGAPIERARWRAARADLRAALEGRVDVGELIRKRTARNLAERFVPPVRTHVAVDNGAATDSTVIDVYTRDRVGLLHAVSAALYRQGVEIVLAKIATEGNRVADSFYVRRTGRKIEDREGLEQIERALREVL